MFKDFKYPLPELKMFLKKISLHNFTFTWRF